MCNEKEEYIYTYEWLRVAQYQTQLTTPFSSLYESNFILFSKPNSIVLIKPNK